MYRNNCNTKYHIRSITYFVILCLVLTACRGNESTNNNDISTQDNDTKYPEIYGVSIGTPISEAIEKLEYEYTIVNDKGYSFYHIYNSAVEKNDEASIADSGIDFFVNSESKCITGYRIMSEGYDFSEGIDINDDFQAAIAILQKKYSEFDLPNLISGDHAKHFSIDETYVLAIYWNQKDGLIESIDIVDKNVFYY